MSTYTFQIGDLVTSTVVGKDYGKGLRAIVIDTDERHPSMMKVSIRTGNSPDHVWVQRYRWKLRIPDYKRYKYKDYP